MPLDPMLDVFLDGLWRSWKALVHGRGGGQARYVAGWFAARSPDPVFTNGVVTEPGVIADLLAFLVPAGAFAVWTLEPATAFAAASSGLEPSEVTVPMVLRVTGANPAADSDELHRDADPAIAERLNTLAAGTLVGVPGVRCYATHGGESGLATNRSGEHVNVSMVATESAARGRG